MSTSTEPERGQQSFAEAALRLSGKTEEEARTHRGRGSSGRAGRSLVREYQTVNSPVHKAVWDGKVPLALFAAVFAAVGTVRRGHADIAGNR